VLAGGAAGLAIVAGPTGGYLVGFVLAAAVVGALLGGKPAHLARVCLVMALGDAIILAAGAAYLFVLGFTFFQAFTLGVAPFLLWDAVKVAVAATSYRLLVGRTR
jgi:biotin transport system substrate-specific component